MDHLVMKARFEEAKRRELAAVRTTSPLPRRVSQSSPIPRLPTAPKCPHSKSGRRTRRTLLCRRRVGAPGAQGDAITVDSVDTELVHAPILNHHREVPKQLEGQCWGYQWRDGRTSEGSALRSSGEN